MDFTQILEETFPKMRRHLRKRNGKRVERALRWLCHSTDEKKKIKHSVIQQKVITMSSARNVVVMWSKLTIKLGNRLGSVSSPALGPCRDFWMMPDARPQSYEYNLRFYNECTFLRQAYIFSWDHVTLTLRFLNNSTYVVMTLNWNRKTLEK